MSEQDLRDCMQQAVWDEPPLNFDPDSLMARAEQLTKRRRALMSVGVSTALIIAAVATLPMFLTAGRGKVDSATGVSTTSTASSSAPVNFPWPPNDAARRNHTFEEDQPFLIQMWVNVLSPGLQQQGVDPASIGTWSPTFQHTGNERAGAVSDMLVGSVSYTGPTGSAILDITIAGVGAWEPSPDQMCARIKSGNGTCQALKRPDGSALVTVDINGNKPSNGSYYSGERTVYHYRRDGSLVAMTSRAQFVEASSYETARIPLTFDQLTFLTTNEGIRLPD